MSSGKTDLFTFKSLLFVRQDRKDHTYMDFFTRLVFKEWSDVKGLTKTT